MFKGLSLAIVNRVGVFIRVVLGKNQKWYGTFSRLGGNDDFMVNVICNTKKVFRGFCFSVTTVGVQMYHVFRALRNQGTWP